MDSNLSNRLIVMKFGGTSLASTAHFVNVAKRIKGRMDEGFKVIAVVSAMGHETDRLQSLVDTIGFSSSLQMDHNTSREIAAVLTSGEVVSAGILALALQLLGMDARSYNAWQIPIVTAGGSLNARVRTIAVDKLMRDLSLGVVPIVTGYQGIDQKHDCVAALGRGGSDTTAVALAAALKALACEIYTDVPGVFDSNPRTNPSAKKYHDLTYEHMREIAAKGAQVLKLESVELAIKHNVPVHVRSSFSHEEGTWIFDGTSNHERGIEL